ncbi:MAG: dihydrolipoyl dehydrogenase, partial [Xanthomonadales bacterium]|nr:dihydrolipoyl dehydrogenase [Xanthomonadales bacterium]
MTEIVQIKVPDIGDVDAVDVIEVLVAPGDTVEEETPLLTLETDKATMEVPSPAAGVVDAVHVSVGDKVSEGHIVVDLKQAAGAAAAEASATEAEPEAETAPAEMATESAATEQAAAPAASSSNHQQPVPEFSGSIHASPS